jgi:hypothetical protein
MGKNTKSKRVQGQDGCPTSPQKFYIFPKKTPYKPLNSLLPLILEIWKEKFEKEILEKGNPNLGITMLFRLRNLWM